MLSPTTWCGLAAVWFILLPPALAADSTPINVPIPNASLRQLLQARQWDAAVAAIDQALQQPEASQDQLLYLKARVLHFQGQYDAAATTFARIEQEFPESKKIVRRARFARAVTLVKQRRFEEAELIYRAEAQQLLSDERRREFADIYLEFADAYFEPEEERAQPDYAKALSFYDKAIDAGPHPDRRLEVELRAARCQLELGMLHQAVVRYEAFIASHPQSPLAIEARYRLGEAHFAGQDLVRARRTWQDLLALHSDLQESDLQESDLQKSDSPEKWIAEAAFRISRTWQIPKPQTDAQVNLGVASLERFLARFPNHPKAAEAHVDIAESYIERQRFSDAVGQLRKLLGDEQYRSSKEIPRARQLLGQALLMQERYDDALATWREFLVEHPSDSAWSDVQRKVIDTEYMVAAAKMDAKEYDTARRLWREFLAKYPLDKRNPEILFLLGQIDVAEEKWDAAIQQWRKLVSMFPKTDEASRAQYEIGVVLEQKLGKLPEALKEYRQVTWGQYASQARFASQRLTSKSMSIVTERTFRSTEHPHLQLTTRNIQSVAVRGYKVNLESYFRKMHQAGQVEALDIALIDPDLTFEYQIDDFEQYQQLENQIDIPLPDGCGAMAVTVSSDTLEATTLVVQSDLDIIVKASRDEVFVFAENMLTQQPWPNCRLLISDGQRVLGEVATDEDGVFQASYEQLAVIEDVRVLAVSGPHVASNAVGLDGIGVAQGLGDKAYIYTDRPAYRAGQQVRVRGCIRQVVDGAYAVEEGKTFDLHVIDPRGRVTWQQGVKLGPYGTLHTDFVLPLTSPQGTYRIQIQETGGERTYAGTFVVHAAKLDPVRLVVDTERFVYCRGEVIEGTIRAEYYYGVPLVARQIRYQLADGRTLTATTDERGEIQFKLPTRHFYEEQIVPLTVELPRWNFRTVVNFQLATQGYTADLTTQRDVYIAGEPFELTIATHDAMGTPVGRKMNLRVFKLSTVESQVGEVPVESHALQTDAADGLARLSLQLGKGGRYRLRAEGDDQWGNPISSQIDILISGDEDQARLRILADQHTFQVGDDANITLHWREEPALALVTFQADRVLNYRLLPLQPGANQLPITLGVELAPNFSLDVAVMTDAHRASSDDSPGSPVPPQRFHTASSPFTVERALNVALSWPNGGQSTLRPGQPIELTVTTTDPQGEPVAAEVGLAMVEQSLLDRFGWPLPPIGQYFRAAPREAAIRTTSSINFDYRPETSRIHPLLLTEEQRIELARDELDSPHGLGAPSVPAEMGEFGAGFGGYGFGGGEESLEAEAEERPKPQRPHVTTIDPFGGSGSGGQTGSIAADTNKVAGKRPEMLSADSAPGRRDIDETAYWNPSVITNERGTATVRIQVPQRSTAWKLIAKGVTVDTLAGEVVKELTAKKQLFGQLKLPSAFVEGDQAEIIASVVNNSSFAGKGQVVLRTSTDGRSIEETKAITIPAQSITDVPFRVELKRPENGPGDRSSPLPSAGNVEFTLTVVANDERDTFERDVPLLPYGLTTYATAGGTADASTTAWIETPAAPFLAPRMQILVGPSIERSLLDIVLPPGPAARISSARFDAAGTETLSSDLMAALGLQRLLAAGPDHVAPEASKLDTTIRSAIGSLASAQLDDGGWTWSSRGTVSDRYTSARAVWALALAGRAGYPTSDQCRQKSLQYIQSQIAATGDSDLESKAVMLHALSVADESSFSLANRLYRDRYSLSAPALLHLALALVEMDRKQMAEELVDLLEQRLGQAGPRELEPAAPPLACNESLLEVAALHALVLQAVAPQTPRAKELIDWLLKRRRGLRWTPDKVTGPAALALCQWYAQSRFEGERYQLNVVVNGESAVKLDMDGAAATRVVDVPPAWLVDGKQQVRFELEGRGRFTYQLVLTGFVPADDLKSSTDTWSVERIYSPAPLERDGKEVPRGFNVDNETTPRFRNPLTQLPTGQRGLVELTIERNASLTTPNEYLEYLIVTEPIPSGTVLIEQSVRGAFERFEVNPGAITFFVGRLRRIGTIHYELHGYLAGNYRAAPTIARNAYRPDDMAVAAAKKLQVLPVGAKSEDEYRLSPQELFELGQRAFRRGEWQQAETLLTDLITNWSLTPAPYRRTVEMLLDTSLELHKPREIIRYFEIVFEKWPDMEVPFSKTLKIAAAYHEMGEFERSYLAFRAAVEGAFTRESGVAGVLDAEGESLRSIAVMCRLLAEYPPEPYIAEAHYSLAQRVYAKAPEAQTDRRLLEAKVTSHDLIMTAWRMFEGFLTEYPLDPAADQAAFSAANALLELKDFDGAAKACQRYANVHTDSDLLDDFWFMVGYSRFALGQHDAARDVLSQVAGLEQPAGDDPFELAQASNNKWPAIYIMGQIEHSQGNVDAAIRDYNLVADRYPDARKSIAYFLRKSIRLPAVTTIKPDQNIKIPLTFRNLKMCDLKVYRIDLMKFTLLRQNLGDVSRINLAGIKPSHAAKIELGDGKDYRVRVKQLSLDVEGEGAYLVVCRGESLFASGFVLVSPLEIEVQHAAAEREVRVTVKNALTGKYVHKADVKVVAVGNSEIVAGQTDQRGLFVAQGIVGSHTVVAQAQDGKYAFYRAPGTIATAGAGTPVEPVTIPAFAAPRIVAAQEVASQSGRSAGIVVAGPGASVADQRIDAALDTVTSLSFSESPLKDVAQVIRQQHRITVLIDRRALDDVGLGDDTPVTFEGRGITLRSALNFLLKELDLVYVIHNEALVITTPEEAENELTTVIYPVTDLVRFRDSEGKPWSDYDTLSNTIQSTVAPDTWNEVGGAGAIEGMRYRDTDVLVISQTQDLHRDIASLLDRLRQVAKRDGSGDELPLKDKSEVPKRDSGYGSYGMGGYGGMGAGTPSGRGAMAPQPQGRVIMQQGPSGSPDLLRGLEETKRRLQGQQMDQLERIYEKGKGGMGGGVGAGGFF